MPPFWKQSTQLPWLFKIANVVLCSCVIVHKDQVLSRGERTMGSVSLEICISGTEEMFLLYLEVLRLLSDGQRCGEKQGYDN